MPTLPTPPERPDAPLSPEDALLAAVTDYVLGDATPEECAALEARMALDPAYAALVDDVRAVWALPLERFLAEDGSVTPPAAPSHMPSPPVDVAAAWAQFEAQLPPLPSAGEMPPVRPLRPPPAPRRWRRRALWAALALFVVSGLWRQLDRRYLHPGRHYHAGATARTIVLPDHTIAWLAPGAYLGTDGRFLQDTRTVYLFGQARFAVARDPAHPFIVRALNVRATALGTTFTMTGDTTARVTVTVHDGKVSLDLISSTGTSTHLAVLTAGQVQSISALSRWFYQAGKVNGRAGVPPRESMHIQDALYRAAAAAAAEAARAR